MPVARSSRRRLRSATASGPWSDAHRRDRGNRFAAPGGAAAAGQATSRLCGPIGNRPHLTPRPGSCSLVEHRGCTSVGPALPSAGGRRRHRRRDGRAQRRGPSPRPRPGASRPAGRWTWPVRRRCSSTSMAPLIDSNVAHAATWAQALRPSTASRAVRRRSGRSSAWAATSCCRGPPGSTAVGRGRGDRRAEAGAVVRRAAAGAAADARQPGAAGDAAAGAQGWSPPPRPTSRKWPRCSRRRAWPT